MKKTFNQATGNRCNFWLIFYMNQFFQARFLCFKNVYEKINVDKRKIFEPVRTQLITPDLWDWCK